MTCNLHYCLWKGSEVGQVHAPAVARLSQDSAEEGLKLRTGESCRGAKAVVSGAAEQLGLTTLQSVAFKPISQWPVPFIHKSKTKTDFAQKSHSC